MTELARGFPRVHVDVGTGDGRHVLHLARAHPDTLCVGLDATADNLQEASHRAGRKPSRGGTPNALFGVLALEQAPAELEGLADEVSVLFPWGSLLPAVALGGGAARLKGLCRAQARVRILFGYGELADPAARERLGVSPAEYLAASAGVLARYREAGFERARLSEVSLEEVAAIPTTWARTIAHAGKARRFFELTATAGEGRCEVPAGG